MSRYRRLLAVGAGLGMLFAGGGTFTVTLECTRNWKKARIEGSDR